MKSSLPRRDEAGELQDGRGGRAAGAFSQLALWTAANLAGVMTALLIAREPFFRRMMKKMGVGRKRRPALPPPPRQSLPLLADAVLGSSKATIASVFGAPRAAVLDLMVSNERKPSFWTASTWYYALPQNGPMAMAINFDENHAHKVEFFQAPVA